MGDNAGKWGASRTATSSGRVPARCMHTRDRKGSYAVPETPDALRKPPFARNSGTASRRSKIAQAYR